MVRHGLPRTPDRLTTNGEGLADGLVFGGFEDVVGSLDFADVADDFVDFGGR